MCSSDLGEYLSMTYYQIWLAGLEKLMAQRELVSPEEMAAGHAIGQPKPVPRTLSAADVAKVLYRGGPTERETNTAPRLSVGDRIRAKNMHPVTHTRLPRYVRGHVGTVERVLGCHVFPDSNSLGFGENPHWLYTVRFAATELWGPTANPRDSVCLDLWEPYLEPA